ncbi:MAG: hypothetical protein U0271_11765 [Polyangiaceae bacterium]
MSLRFLAFASTVALAFACACGGQIPDEAGPSAGGGGSGAGGGPVDESFPLACDPLVPYCGYPFPSNVYTVEDSSTQTGLRVAFKSDGLPIAKDGHHQSPDPWSKSDGFSASAAILAYFPGLSATGLPTLTDLGASLADDSPTVLIDAETGEHMLHWAELDASKDFDETPSLIIRPAAPLRDGTRYIVAIRGLVDTAGAPIVATPAFASLRDGTPSDHPSIEARRPLYADIFSRLEAEGIAREGLLLAWDFTTASRESNTSWLVHMRDEALSAAGDTGPAYTITSVDTTLDPANILYRIKGTMTVPLYLDQPGPGASLVFGADGMPEPNPDTPTYEVEWELLIPNSAVGQPAKLLHHGHGLLGDNDQIESQNFRTFCNQYDFAVFSTRLDGMATDDQMWLIEHLTKGEIDELTKMHQRLHQGFLNNLLVTRMMINGLAKDPLYGIYLNPDYRYYWGISQGGIMGGVTASLSTDIQYSLLEVMGQPYNLLLNRSQDFIPFFTLANIEFADSRAQQHMLALLQMTWDRVEPSGYTKYAFDDPFPGSLPGRRVLLRAALGDHQVTTFGAHVMARAMGAKHLDTKIRDVYGLELVTDPQVDADGAVYTEYDFGLPPEPLCNVPMSSCDDPHGELRSLDEAREQAYLFFVTGVAENRCANQACDFSQLSGCTGDEDLNLCD